MSRCLGRCAKCGRNGVYFNEPCDGHGKKTLFYLCEEHQAEYMLMTERFLGLRRPAE